MKTLTALIFLFGVSIVAVVTCAPAARHKALPLSVACSILCPDDYHPVCAVNAMGMPKTFANRCFVDVAYCRERQYYVHVKEGEC